MERLTKKEVRAYVVARYPTYKRDNPAGGWRLQGKGRFLSDADARLEAEAEKWGWEEGISKRPEWLT